MTLYRLVEFGDLEKEPVQWVGVHPVKWHNRPEQPTAGFVETDYTTEEFERLAAAEKALQSSFNQVVDERNGLAEQHAALLAASKEAHNALLLEWDLSHKQAIKKAVKILSAAIAQAK